MDQMTKTAAAATAQNSREDRQFEMDVGGYLLCWFTTGELDVGKTAATECTLRINSSTDML